VSGGAYAGALVGNQYQPANSYGPDNFIRPHRFVFSGTYQIPTPTSWSAPLTGVLGGWALSGVLTLQDGDRLSITNTVSTNAFGITNDFAELSPNCTLANIPTPGAVENKLTNYINASCFGNTNAPLPIIGSDGKATGFGNTGPGILYGPAQENLDLNLAKLIPLKWPHEKTNLEVRFEGFNVFNTPLFANPVTAVNSATFGQVLNTAGAPRIFQIAMKVLF
jgi:hypothetical protein